MKRRQGGRGEFWSGVLWLCSAFLDCADGELARIGKMQSRGGHLFDYFTDVAVNCGFFLAAGINLYKAGAGNWSIRAGVLACAVMIACSLLAEAYESEVATGERVWEGGWGFQPDLAAAAVVTSVIAVIFLASVTRTLPLMRRNSGLMVRVIKSHTNDMNLTGGPTTTDQSIDGVFDGAS
jgi:phosphatidylglycerophosphate synthase